MKKLVYTREDGGVSIVIPAPKADLEKILGPLTEAEYKAHVTERSIPAGVTAREVDDSELPSDRTFRDAWQDSGVVISHDMNKCRAILKDRRNKKLEELDARATTESRKPNGKLDEVNTKAQRLRDIPEDDKFSGSIQDLKDLDKEIRET